MWFQYLYAKLEDKTEKGAKGNTDYVVTADVHVGYELLPSTPNSDTYVNYSLVRNVQQRHPSIIDQYVCDYKDVGFCSTFGTQS